MSYTEGAEVGSTAVDNVESLYGDVVISQTPNPATIAVLKDMLEAALSGEIVGFTGAVLHGDRSCSTRYAGLASYALLGALSVAQVRLAAQHLDSA